jgi:hypothetical protein
MSTVHGIVASDNPSLRSVHARTLMKIEGALALLEQDAAATRR